MKKKIFVAVANVTLLMSSGLGVTLNYAEATSTTQQTVPTKPSVKLSLDPMKARIPLSLII